MSNYTYSTNFGAKDALNTGDPNKLIKGVDFDTEFNAISTAIATKADLASPTFTGTITLPTAVVTTLSLNGTTVTSTASELNLVDGSSAGTVVNNKAVVYSSAGQVKATTLSIGSWVIKVDTNELVFEYNSTEVFKVGTNGAITSANNVTAYGTI